MKKRALWPGMPAFVLFCAAGPAALASGAQAASSFTATPTHAAPASAQPDNAQPQGKVLFERHEAAPQPEVQPDPVIPRAPQTRARRRQGLQHHDSDSAREATTSAPADAKESSGKAPSAGFSSSADTPLIADQSPKDAAAARTISDEERRAVHILREDLDMHLDQHSGETAVRARLLLRNDGGLPLIRVALQISSALHWQSASMRQAGASQPLHFEEHRLITDADHTGAATEVALNLPEPLVPGGEATIELFYGGTLSASADRLIRLGAPADRAAQSEWDMVTDSFTGLRGFGNVLWFPVAAVPAFLADGADFAAAVDAQRGRSVIMSLRLVLQTTGKEAAQAFFAGRAGALDAVPAADGTGGSGDDQIFTQVAQWKDVPVGPHPASLFLSATPSATPVDGISVGGEAAGAGAYRAAAHKVLPLLTAWLGEHPASALTVLDLPVRGDQPFADGALLVLPVAASDARVLAPALVYPLAAAWLPADAPAWLRDGLPEFLRLVYIEQTAGRDSLLAELNAGSGPLARQEGFRTASSLPLTACADAACARTKSAYVFTMLRQMVGDRALEQAITGLFQPGTAAATDSADGKSDARRFESLLTQASGKDLRWFFKDWIDTDAGLPQLTIVSVAPRRVDRSMRTDYLPSQRRPVAGPIGAEPVAQAGDPILKDSATEASRGRVAPADGSWLVAVEVRNDGDAAAEVPVTVRASGLQNTLPLRIAAHSRATVRVPFEAAPEEVWVNDGTTPEMHGATHHKSIDIPAEAR